MIMENSRMEIKSYKNQSELFPILHKIILKVNKIERSRPNEN